MRRAPFFHSRFKSRTLQYLEALLRWNQPAELRFAVLLLCWCCAVCCCVGAVLVLCWLRWTCVKHCQGVVSCRALLACCCWLNCLVESHCRWIPEQLTLVPADAILGRRAGPLNWKKAYVAATKVLAFRVGAGQAQRLPLTFQIL